MRRFRPRFESAKRRIKATLGPVIQRWFPPERASLAASRWDLESRPGQGLCVEGVSLAELVRRWGSPLHVVRRATLIRNAARFLAVPEGRRAGCEVYYSYKTNPVPGVLSILHAANVGAEVISPYELWLASRLGVPPERIVYNGPAKADDAIREAIARGIGLLVANHTDELEVFARIATELGKRPRVALRVTTDAAWGAQLGTPIAGGAALAAFARARAASSLDVVGLHAHRGHGIRTEAELRAFVGAVLSFADVLHREQRWAPEVLDFGGSLTTPTVAPVEGIDHRLNRALFRALPAPDPDSALSIERYLARLVEQVELHYAERGRARPRIAVEPGRAMTGDAQLLLGRVRALNAGEERTFAVLDMGINLAESVRNEYHQLFHADRPDAPARRVYTVVGPICTPADTLYGGVRLPELRIGDTLAVMDTGAYFVPFSTTFSFPRPAIVLLEDGRARLLRRAETFDDLVARDELAGSPI